MLDVKIDDNFCIFCLHVYCFQADANAVDIRVSYILLASKNHPYQKSSSLDTTKVDQFVIILIL